MSRVTRYLLKRLYVFCAIALITAAVLVQLGRSFSYLVSDYSDELATYLSDRIGLDLTFGNIQADWQGLKPVLQLYNVRLQGDAAEQILALDHARLQLDLWGSLIRGRLHWDTIALRGADMELQQLSDGRWQIPGLPRVATVDLAPDTPTPDDFFALFLLGSHIRFQDTHFTFRFADDHLTEFYSSSVLLENSRGFHRLAIDIDIDDRKDAVLLVVEGRGDPRNLQEFRSRGYLQLRDIPTMEPLSAAVAALLGGIDRSTWYGSGSLDASIWFDSRSEGDGFDLTGQLQVSSLTIPQPDRVTLLHRLETDITGYWLRTGAWHVALQNFNAFWDDLRLENLNAAVSSPQAGTSLQVSIDRLDLQESVRLLNDSRVLGQGVLQDVVQTLAPRGELHNIRLELPRDSLRDWQLIADLRSVAVNPWQGVPGLSGIDGLLQASERGGSVDLDSRDRFSMFYQDIYTRPMVYQRARGQVAWWLQPENNRIYVNSGLLELGNDSANTHEDAHGYLWLSIPWRRNSGDIDLYLHIGARDVSANLHRKYVPARVPEPLLRWLDRSIGANNIGRASEGGFLFRGTLNTSEGMARTYQLAMDVEDAWLDYHPSWPPISQLSGRLLLNDNLLTATIDRGQIYNSQLSQVSVKLGPNPRGRQPLLQVQGKVSGFAGDGLRVLRESMLRQFVGDNMDSWFMLGKMQAHMQLDVPLGQGEPGSRQQVDIDVDASSMALDNFGVELANVAGAIRYNSEKGLSSERLTAQLFNEPLSVAISSHRSTTDLPQTHIYIESRVSSENLTRVLERPELLFFEGESDVAARIELTHNPAQVEGEEKDDLLAAISVNTDLNGVKVSLPGRYAKEAADSRSLALNLILGRQTALVEARYGEELHGIMQFERNSHQLLNANLALGAGAHLRDQPQLLLSGYLDDLNIQPWQQLLEDYQQFSARFGGGEQALPALADLPPLRAEILLRNHQVGPLQLSDLALRAARVNDAWQLGFSNETLAGTLLVPSVQQPLQLSLDFLHFTRPPEQEPLNEELALTTEAAPFDPRNLPNADVTVSELHIDGQPYGHFSFNVRPDSEGAVFEELRADIRALQIHGQEPDSGAHMRWYVDELGQQHTRFSGLVSAGDLANAMREWQLPAVIESQQANYQAELNWQGAPHDFSVDSLRGSIGIDIRNGRFTRAPAGGGDGMLRLFATLNFDSLARRLRLDFSDLYQGGLAYDDIRGRVSFNQGSMFFSEPLQVRSPSSRMQLAGSVNLLEETLDARLIATLPVAGNLTFLAALAAGLPAAAGVYLVSKLFEKQVDQATSISYTIRGGWDDPQVKFDRMFEGDSSARNE